MKTIIYAHPYDQSLNHAILAGITAKFKSAGTDYQVIDLYADGFNPVLTAADLRQYNQGTTTDPLARRYGHLLQQTDELVLIFPMWWYGLPAMLKGFFDKVMLPDLAYTSDAAGMLTGNLTNIRKTTLAVTAGQPLSYFEKTHTDSVKTTFMTQILPDLGIAANTVQRFHIGTVDLTPEQGTAFIKQVVAAV